MKPNTDQTPEYVSIPKKPRREHIQAIFAAWDHYGSSNQPRLLGTPEAERICREIFNAVASP